MNIKTIYYIIGYFVFVGFGTYYCTIILLSILTSAGVI